jgi:TolB-like protein/Flp pilus assembly protein TadD
MNDQPEEKVVGLRRHRMFRIATIYVVAGWLSIQAADIVLEAFESPAWVMRTFLILVVAGLPLTLMGIWLVDRTGHSRPSSPLGFLLTIGVALVISSAAYLYFSADHPAALREFRPMQQGRTSNPVLAVLPFANMSSVEANAHLAHGLTEDIITLLAQSPGVEVIARNSTFKYEDQNPDIRDVGRDLGADYVIEGSIRPLGERIRVTVQVIDAVSGAHIWAEKYDRPLADFFDIQDEVSLGVAAAVGDAVFKEDHSRIALSRTDNLTARALVSQAEMAFTHEITGDENGRTKARQAMELDPDYALAHATLGRALALNSGYYRDAAIAKEAEAEARLAAKLDPDDPKVNAFLAFTLLTIGQPVEALPYAERVPQISPSYAEGLVYYADILTHNGRSQEALPYFEKAIRLTPNAPQLGWYHWLQGEAFIHHGNFAEAEASLLTANRFYQGEQPTLLHLLAGTQLQLGKVAEARASLDRAAKVADRSVRDDVAMWEFFSSDGGGEYYTIMWADLMSLSTERPQ